MFIDSDHTGYLMGCYEDRETTAWLTEGATEGSLPSCHRWKSEVLIHLASRNVPIYMQVETNKSSFDFFSRVRL